ncbi:hypothetical protein [Enterococcus sp. AZ109]|uniref:hypothetical protein n=1 Tax=Enterococcus sp. AZ109 TaxID=2774634 RepID=UPI003F27BD32
MMDSRFLTKQEILTIFLLTALLVASKINPLLNGGMIVATLFVISVQCIKNPMIAIFWSFWFGESLSGLLPQKVNIIFFSIQVVDISILCLIIFIFFSLRKGIPKLFFSSLLLIAIGWFALLIIGSIKGVSNTNQSILMTIFTQRRVIPFILLPLVGLGLYRQDNPLEKIEYYITRIAVAIILISISQWILMYAGGPIIFEGAVNMRLGYRLYVPITITRFAATIVWIRMITQKITIQRLMFITGFFVQIIFINQGRASLISVIATFILGILLFTKIKAKPIVVSIVIIFASMLIATPLGNSFLDYYLGDIGSTDTNNNIGFREYEQNFYEGNLKGNEVLGLGGINNGDINNEHLIGTQRGMYLSDLGVFEVKYYYGVIGVLMFYVTLIICIAVSFERRIRKKHAYFLLLFIYGLIISSTQSYFYFGGASFPVMIALLFVQRKKLKTDIFGL